MVGGQKENGICVVAKGPICTLAFLLSRLKTPFSLLDSRTMKMVMVSKNGFLNWMVDDTVRFTCAATDTCRASKGGSPRPCALYTHCPTSGCSKTICASSFTPNDDGLYSMVMSDDSSGGRTTRLFKTLKLILLVDRYFKTTSCPVGLSMCTVVWAVLPSSHSKGAISSAGAASASRLRSYQNSPTISLKKTAVPLLLAGKSGLNTNS
mmetsp:Transcript_47329/g.103235  ORF Transcript_47329/g.103235 Transcript_47329/m.103235 type:complete len:208 (+) Transcript_47329:1008-1631(+)